MTQCYAQTMPGVEKIAWLEIRDRLPQARFEEYLFAKEKNGIVVFGYDASLDTLLQLRTTEDVFVQALYVPKLQRSRRDLQLLAQQVEKGEPFGRAVNDFMRFLKPSKPPTYRVISRLYGKHPYKRGELNHTVARSLQKRYPRWMPVADGGQVEIWVNVLGSQLLVGLRLSDRTMRHRHQKKVELPASLRPSVAAAMITLTQPQPEDVFADPMCGSGTLLLERRAFGPAQQLLGGDIIPERADAAQQNLLGRSRKPRHGKRAQPPQIMQWDALRLPLATHSIDKLATNLPFGKQLGSPEEVKRLYPAFFAEMARVLQENGRAVILSSEFDLVKECVRQQPTLQIITGYSIAILGKWGRIYIIEKS
ncbi:MAG: RNA methyltransferase [Ardenticatenaceae bacterium]|nr:RNA methyltransferase [Ardenticatenaceae bacterium]MCB8990956.1 RNA methyltransferase [Ardenticatenaceae bacterium]MCB9004393.1 RNA methyltransferase [Ardenticatenaceae bacterium]